MLLAAKIPVAKAWETSKVSLSSNKNKIPWIMAHEKSASILKVNQQQLGEYLGPWIIYIQI